MSRLLLSLLLASVTLGDVTPRLFPRLASDLGGTRSGGVSAWSLFAPVSTTNEPIAMSACGAQLGTLANASTPDSKDFRTSPLLLYAFGFAVPLNASIDLVRVEVMRAHSSGQAEDATVELVVGTAARSDNEESNTAWSDQLSLRQYTFGTDRLSAADVNSDSFGVRLVVESTGNGPRSSGVARINCVLASVQFTPGRATTARPTTTRPTTTPRSTTVRPTTAAAVGSTAAPAGNSSSGGGGVNNIVTMPDVPSPSWVVPVAVIVPLLLLAIIGGLVGAFFFLKRRAATQAGATDAPKDVDKVEDYLSTPAAPPAAPTPASQYGKVPGKGTQEFAASNLPLPDMDIEGDDDARPTWGTAAMDDYV